MKDIEIVFRFEADDEQDAQQKIADLRARLQEFGENIEVGQVTFIDAGGADDD